MADFFQGTFDIPLDGIESDIEGFEGDISDVAESLDSIPMEEDEEDLPRFPDQSSEDEDSDSSEDRDSGEEERERGRPARFTFENVAWSEQRSEMDIPQFREEVGPTKILPAEASAKDFFSLLVDERMLSNTVRETNKYAKQKLEESGKDSSLWSPVDLTELKAFIGLLIAISFHSLPSLKDIWSEDWILGMPALTKVMSRKRFLDLLYNMHVNDNSTLTLTNFTK